MSEWYDYMIRASKHAKDDNELWIRYLYKVIDYRWIRLTDEDYEDLMKCEELSSEQKSILRDAMTEGTDVRNRVIRANQKFQQETFFQCLKEVNMDALEIAYSEEWLTNYLEEHLEDLRKFAMTQI